MTKIINGIKHMTLSKENHFKIQSLEDNVYFTLREILLNADAYNICLMADSYSNQLSGGISYKDRTGDFQYTNVLHEKQYVRELSYWLNSITEQYFEFDEEVELAGQEHNQNNPYDENEWEYMRFDEWWKQFQYLKKLVNKRASDLALENTRNLWIPRYYEIPHTHHL